MFLRFKPAGCLVLVLWSATASAQMFNVTFLHTPPKRILEERDYVISGNIVGADQVSIAALNFRWPGEEEFQVRELRLVSGDRYEGAIPAQFVKPPAIEYFCYAVDFEGNRHIIFASEEKPHQVTVLSREEAEKEKAIKEGKKPKKTKTEIGEELKRTRDRRRAERVVSVSTGVGQPAEEAPGMISVITREDIEGSGAQTVADLMDLVPGISVARSVSGDYRLTVRGVQTDPGVLVLLDGQKINDPASGAALLEFPAEGVERLEIMRGPGSALHGDGALVGAIHVISRKQGYHGSVAYGWFNTVRSSAGAHHDTDSFAVGGQLQFVYTQGQDRMVEADAFTGIQMTEDDTSTDVSNTPASVDDGRTQVHAHLHGALKDLGGGELGLTAHYLFQTRGALVGKLDTLDRGSELSVHLMQTDLTYQLPVTDWLQLNSKAFFQMHMVNRVFQSLPADSDYPYETEVDGSTTSLTGGLRDSVEYQAMTVGADVSTRFQLGAANSLLAGLKFEYLSLPTFSLLRETGEVDCEDAVVVQGHELPCGSAEATAEGKDRIAFGFYLQDQWKDLFDGFDVLAGVRLDYFTDVGLVFTPRAGLVYSPLDGLWIKLLYAQGYRTPTFQELYETASFDPRVGVAGNDSLSPVVVHSLEFGLEAHVSTRPADYLLRGQFFYNWLQDGIGAGSGGRYQNLEAIDVLGTELEAVAYFGTRSRLFVNSSWFRARVKSDLRGSDSYITDVPQLRFNLGMVLALLDWLNLHVGVSHGSERRSNVHRELELLYPFVIPATTTVRTGLSTEPFLFEHVVAFANAYNVFDHDVRDPAPRPDRLPGMIPRAPFTFLVGLAWRP